MLILVGPSASGKTEAVKLLIKEHGMEKLITYTSRPQRINEKTGVDYHFISKEEFEQKIQDGFFLEYVNYNNNYYGTAYEDLASNKVVILEPNGVFTYISKVPNLVKVCYLQTPICVRQKRMEMRGDDSESISKRIAGDDLLFNQTIEKQADWVIDSTDITLEEMTTKIYNLYKPFI